MLEKLFKEQFFAERFALIFSFNSFTKVLRISQFYFDILLHSKCQVLRAVSSHAEKDLPQGLCLYLTAKK